MLVVKEAKIEIVKPTELRVGDQILWSNRNCTIDTISINYKKIYTTDSNGLEFGAHGYLRYYKILECEEVNICSVCGERLDSGDCCDDCNKMSEEDWE